MIKNAITSTIKNKVANDNPMINAKRGPLLITLNEISWYMLS